MMKLSWLTVLLCSVLSGPLYLNAQAGKAAEYEVSVRRISPPAGSASEVLHNGVQDQQGFIWLGSREGLIRFDGYDFLTFTKQTHDFPSNNIIRAVASSDGWLWLLCGENSFDNTGEELILFHPITKEVKKFENMFPEVRGIGFAEILNCFDTALVLSSNDGDIFTFQRNVLRKLPVRTGAPGNIMIASNGWIWTSYSETHLLDSAGTFALDFRGNILWKAPRHLGLITAFDSLHRPIFIYWPPDRSFHVPQLLKANGVTEHYPLLSVTDSAVKSLFTSYVFQTYNQGRKEFLFRDIASGIYLKPEQSAPVQLLDSARCAEIPHADWRRAMFRDKTGKYWIATSEGLYVISVVPRKFQKILSGESKAQYVPIRGICTDPQSNLYISAGDLGHFKVDVNNEISLISFSQNYHLSHFFNDTVYIAGDFIESYCVSTQKLSKYPRTKSGYVWTIFKDMEGYWWVSGEMALLRGPSLYGPWEDYSRRIYGAASRNTKAYQIFEADSKYWFSCSTGLYWADLGSDSFGRLNLTDRETGEELLQDIHHVYRDDEYWWIATNGQGLLRLNRSDMSYKRWTTGQNLSSNVLYAIMEDRGNNLWISSNFGLMQYHKKSGEIKTYTTSHGLPHQEFNRISWCQDPNGQLYFAGLNGVVKFNPQDFEAHADLYAADLRVTAFYQYNELKKALENRLDEIEKDLQIRLLPSTSFFTMDLRLLDFNQDNKRFAYKLSGLDTSWEFLENNQLYLGNLPYGEYVLYVKGQNQEGQWSSKMLSIPVSVIPPFYLRWWFLFICVILSAGLMMGIVRWRTYNIQKERIRLQNEVDRQTREISTSLYEKELLLKEVHHRVKNNLQIISSLLSLEQNKLKASKSRKLFMDAKSRIKSMALIHKNLYQHNDLSCIVMKDYLSELVTTLDKTYRLRSSLKVECIIEDNDTVLDLDTAIPVGLIVTEIVSNSYKYAFKNRSYGKIWLRLYQSEMEMSLFMGDDGIGLPQKFVNLQVDSLGLQLVNLLVKQLKGNLQVHLQEGTEYHIRIPKRHNA